MPRLLLADLVSPFCCEPDDAKIVAKRILPYFKAGEKVILSFAALEVLTPEFVEWVFDPFFSKFKADKVIRLIRMEPHCFDLDMAYLFRQGQLASFNKHTGLNKTRIRINRKKGKSHVGSKNKTQTKHSP